MALWLAGENAGALCTARSGVTHRRRVKGQTDPTKSTCAIGGKQSRAIKRTLLLGHLWKPGLKKRYAIGLGIVLVLIIGAGIVWVSTNYDLLAPGAPEKRGPPDPEVPQPPSPSKERIFAKAAVCSDGPPCSTIGKDILLRNGSAMDAALATMFCNGIVNYHSMGLGGGFLMTFYKHSEKTAYTLNAREKAPAKAAPDMYKNNPKAARSGGLAVAVPGELKGYWEAHKKFGSLPWAEIVNPSIKVCEEGYNMTKHQSDSLLSTKQIDDDPYLHEIFTDPATGKYHRAGSLIKHKALCKTLRVIAEKGGDELYTGELGTMLAEDIQQLGGIITKEDLINYQPKWETPITLSLQDDVLYTVPPPGSGVLVGLILQILHGYNFSSESVDTINNTILTYHRITEAYKWAFAERTQLGDGEFVDISKLMSNLTSLEFANSIREKIRDNETDQDPKSYGAVVYNKEDHGTAHVSVIAPNGDAASITSTVNYYFGAGVTSKQTGIVLNNCMDDFSSPDFDNYFGIPGSPANAIAPGKRPLSSMSPTIIIGSDGNVKMVVGASGGTKISTAVSFVIMRYLWFGESIKQAIDASRFHHQLIPMEISYEYGVLDQVLKGLQELGHKTKRYRDRGSIICGVTKRGNEIIANADFRKGGEVDGF